MFVDWAFFKKNIFTNFLLISDRQFFGRIIIFI